MKKKTTTMSQEEEKLRYQEAVRMVQFLVKIGQIKKMPSEAEMKAYWEKLKKY